MNWRDFEMLVSILLLHEDIEAKIYNRLGADAGIDVKSSDGKTVYQVKHTTKDFSDIISRAKQEFKKIKKYRSESHKNFPYWKGVKKWCLVTNASCNPSDYNKWDTEIKKIFEDIGLEVKLIHERILAEKLIKYPSLKAEYFNGDNRVLLSLPEAVDSKKNDTIFDKGFKPEFIVGRDKEKENFFDFIKSDKKIISIHGPGGVGKTRFAIEVAMQANKKFNYDIFWANTATMEKSTSWFQSIVSGRKTLLIIDEPTEKRTIEILLEQTASQRISEWKFAIITRSSKDHILKPLNPEKRNDIASPIELKALDKEMIEKITWSLIENSDKLKIHAINNIKDDLLRFIVKTSGGIPIWVIVAIKLIEDKGNINTLPKDDYNLAKQYIEECLSSLIPDKWEKYKNMLKAIAILQPINIEDDPQLFDGYFKPLLGKGITEAELERVFKILQQKNLAGKRGRLLEIKPDVIRDYIILNLIGNNKKESKNWAEKILSMTGKEKKKSAIKQIARIAYDKKTQKIKEDQEDIKTFLDPIWDTFIQKAKTASLKELEGDNQEYDIGLFDLANTISFSNLLKFTKFIESIQKNERKLELVNYSLNETNHSTYLDYKNLINRLSEALYEAGKYSQSDEESKQVFRELLNLAETEQKFIGHYNNTPKALHFIDRLMPKDRYFNNIDVVSNWVIRRLDQIDKINDNENQIKILIFLVKDCFFRLEKNISEYANGTLIGYPVIFRSKSKYNNCKNDIFKEIWSILNSNKAHPKIRKILWEMLKTYQYQLRFISNKVNEQDKSNFNKEMNNNLRLIKDYLSKNNVDIVEFQTLKSIWKWHLRNDNRVDFANLAEECNNLIFKKTNKQDFINLYEGDFFQINQEKLKEYLKNSNDKNKIYDFVEDDFNFSKNKPIPVSGLWNDEKLRCDILKYIKKVIKNSKNDHHFKVACEFIYHQSNYLREKNKKHLCNILINYWCQLKNTKKRETFLDTIYWSMPGPRGKIRKEDIQFITNILSQSREKLSNKCFETISYFAGNSLFLDFNQSKKIIETVLEETQINNRHIAFKSYVEGANDRYVRRPNYKMPFPDQSLFEPKKDMFPWLISLLEYIPSIEFSKINYGKGLNQIKKDLGGKLSIIDFIELLNKRLELLKQKDSSCENISWDNIFWDIDFVKIIDPVTEKDASSDPIKKSLNQLLNFNNESVFYYKLPNIVAKMDPFGFLIPTLIVKRIKDKEFSDKKWEDTSPIHEWSRYGGYYSINSKAWRVIAQEACDIAINKTQKEKEKISIFSSLLNHRIQTIFSNYGEISSYYYNKVEDAKSDFNKESDPYIKEFMKWRWNSAKKELEREKEYNIEKPYD